MQNEGFVSDKFTIDELLRRSWNHRNSREFARFFDFIARFDHYSRFNTMLVYIQNAGVTFFGGTSYWKKKFNRTIRRDARPYIILAPKGPVMLVYDIFETDGKLSPAEFLEKGLGSKPDRIFGTIDVGLLSSMIQKAGEWGVRVITKQLSYFNGGYVTTAIRGNPEIYLKEGASNEENLSVLIHELAHLMLGHLGQIELKRTEKGKPYRIEGRKLSRSAEELEAETISFLLCKKLGLETRSAEYIAGYITHENDLLQFSYEQVIKTADRIETAFFRPMAFQAS